MCVQYLLDSVHMYFTLGKYVFLTFFKADVVIMMIHCNICHFQVQKPHFVLTLTYIIRTYILIYVVPKNTFEKSEQILDGICIHYFGNIAMQTFGIVLIVY